MLFKPKFDALNILALNEQTTIDAVKAFLQSQDVAFDFVGQTPDDSFVVHVSGGERTLLLPRGMMLVCSPDGAFGADPRIVNIFYTPNPTV